MNKFVKYSIATLLGIAVLTVLGTIAYINRPPTLLEKIAVKEAQHAFIVTTMASGCTAAGIKDPQLGQALAMTRGMVCLQVLEETLPNELRGQGFCKPDDKRCLFSVAYIVTAIRGLGKMPSSSEEEDQLQSDLDDAYEKVYATKEKQ